jgi:hypothetical protein
LLNLKYDIKIISGVRSIWVIFGLNPSSSPSFDRAQDGEYVDPLQKGGIPLFGKEGAGEIFRRICLLIYELFDYDEGRKPR